MLKVKNVTKTFGKITALESVSFDVDKGEFVFICGPSGVGKTTLIRLIMREFLPDTGEIIFAGHNIFQLPAKEIPTLRRQIGVVFQDFKVLPERTLRENIEVALAVIGLPQDEWGVRVENVLKLTGLSRRAGLFPSQLSGGELQRASLARALVVNPKLILADEPTGNLDWDTADEIMKLLAKINEKGRTVIMATHHRLIVEKMGKRVIELKEGKVVGRAGEKSASNKAQKKNRVKVKVEEK